MQQSTACCNRLRQYSRGPGEIIVNFFRRKSSLLDVLIATRSSRSLMTSIASIPIAKVVAIDVLSSPYGNSIINDILKVASYGNSCWPYGNSIINNILKVASSCYFIFLSTHPSAFVFNRSAGATCQVTLGVP